MKYPHEVPYSRSSDNLPCPKALIIFPSFLTSVLGDIPQSGQREILLVFVIVMELRCSHQSYPGSDQ